jgi:hypothetical protein
MIDAAALHRAADKVWNQVHTPTMDALAEAGAVFLDESRITDEFENIKRFHPESLGYGIMLGYLAAQEEMGI